MICQCLSKWGQSKCGLALAGQAFTISSHLKVNHFIFDRAARLFFSLGTSKVEVILKGLKMHDRSITIVFASMLGLCMLGVMACTLWILFTGSAIELALGIVGSVVSVYMFIDVSNDLN